MVPAIAVATAFFSFTLEASSEDFRQKTGVAAPSFSDSKSDALKVIGPFRLLSERTRSAVFIMAGPPPVVRPDTPVERWMWVFLKETREVEGARSDTVAILSLIDCSASTAQNLRKEMFRSGTLQKAIPMSSPASQHTEGAIGDALVKSACDPEYGKNSRYFMNLSAASGAAIEIFSRGAKTTTDPEKSPPLELGSSRERLPIRQTDSGFAENTFMVKMTEGPAPTQKPDGPVDIWEWTFLGRPMTVAGKTILDATATLLRVDCDKQTSQSLAEEYYADGKLESAEKPSKELATAKPAIKRLVASACDPTYKPDAPTFPDFRAAQAEAVKIIADRKRKSADRKKTSSGISSDMEKALPSSDSSSSLSGEAERVDTPLRLVALNRKVNSFFMAANAAPKERPVRPIEVWIWEFTHKARRLDGRPSYDTWATRMRVDCNAGTVRHQLREGYREGRFDNSWELMGKARKAARGSLDNAVLSAACDPDYRTGGQRFNDHRAARKAVLNTTISPRRK
jgi:hypothetical protein